MAKRILLPNGCSMSTPSVNPKNYKTGGQTLLNKDWYIQYYFYDPTSLRKKKLCIVKGMNEYKDLKERREVTRILIQNEIHENRQGFNPILDKYVVVENLNEAELHGDLDFITAFQIALTKVEASEKHIYQIECAIKRIAKAAKKLNKLDLTISELQRKDLKLMFENCNLPDNYFNKYIKYISRIFVELLEYECCQTNLTRDIRSKKTVRKKRETLNSFELKTVLNYLEENYYEFWRYAMIFLYSGGRSTEFFSLKKEDVNLDIQEFNVTIKKGNQYKEVTKVILKPVINLWKELLQEAKNGDYIFSKGLKPGKTNVNSNQITRRWYRLVKNSDKIKYDDGKILKITADFYSLKHSFLDTLEIDKAMKMACHTTSKTTSIYQVNKEKRDREMLKQIDVSL
ncbi:site-specific integrase [Mesonia sp. K4-1]|uniref:tyrosine-type recombinase/integrase n=1 Tax=Mesonia sp. K4-1 TaxID=2602760 RepID=UPI0011CA3582|nr:site-specific integrase [Mesonia sp. K4-1]TXK78671.1 site-specific integrase [Mesonia sp. K4-1]